MILGFFGLTRSLRHTAAALSKRIEQPLRPVNVPIKKLGHFNLPELIFNPRSNELGLIPDPAEARLLDLDHFALDPQDHAQIADVLAVATAFPDRFGDQHRSTRNLCHQLNSLRRLWSLILAHGVEPDDIILFLRPDLLYIDPLNIQRDIMPLIENQVDLIVPAWHGWGGLNDRFAFCNATAAAIYATRYNGIIEACLTMNGLHAETYLHAVIANHGLRTGFTDLRAARIRADGAVAPQDRGMMMPLQADPSA